MVKEVVLIMLIALSNPVSTVEYIDLGDCRITEYCPTCNDGSGYESSSGIELKSGYCACAWLPEGAEISVEGEPLTVVDTCGTEAIDVFIDTDECECNLNEKRKVTLIENTKKSFADMVVDKCRKMARHGMDRLAR